MLRSRIIPCLLIQNKGLVKTVKFKDSKYVGDPINAVRIFNEKEVDELMILDIDATVDGVGPNFETVRKLAQECRMPFCYGGGVKTPAQANELVRLGAEKVAISSEAISNPKIISAIAEEIGSQSVVIVLDIKKKRFSANYQVWTHNGTVNTKQCPLDLITLFEELGAGEVVINYIDLDGMMTGYEIVYSNKIRKQTHLPLTILGGAGSYEHFKSLVSSLGVIGAAAGSFFVFKGPYKAVLISYLSNVQKTSLSSNSSNSDK